MKYRISEDTWLEMSDLAERIARRVSGDVRLPDLDPKYPKKDDPDLDTFKKETDVIIRKIIRDEVRRLNEGEPVKERGDE